MTWILVSILAFFTPAYALDLVDLGQPESVTFDPKTGNYYISNINGVPTEKDNNGYISKVSPDGLVVVIKFIEPKPGIFDLHAPKGLYVRDGLLFVTDIDAVKAFSLETGENTQFIDLSQGGAQFLNDITGDAEGNLFVSDMTANRIWKLDGKKGFKASVFAEGPELGQPNGLVYHKESGSLIAAGWQSGELTEVARDGKVTVLRKDMGEGLDGLAADRRGTLFVSSYKKGEIYIVKDWGKGALELFQSGLNTPADIHYDPSTRSLLVPLMGQGALTSFAVPEEDEPREPKPKSAQEKKSRGR